MYLREKNCPGVSELRKCGSVKELYLVKAELIEKSVKFLVCRNSLIICLLSMLFHDLNTT